MRRFMGWISFSVRPGGCSSGGDNGGSSPGGAPVNVWLMMLLTGILTYAIRLSFILFYGKKSMPPRLQQGLRFVPPAVLSAIIFPELLVREGELDLSFGNPRLLRRTHWTNFRLGSWQPSSRHL
jgi:branched-subunit amino acid transport protein